MPITGIESQGRIVVGDCSVIVAFILVGPAAEDEGIPILRVEPDRLVITGNEAVAVISPRSRWSGGRRRLAPLAVVRASGICFLADVCEEPNQEPPD
jgi:hypothetical protein